MKNEDIAPEKHAANAKQVASWSIDHKAYIDWLSVGDLEIVIKENEVQAVADLPATMLIFWVKFTTLAALMRPLAAHVASAASSMQCRSM